MVDPIDVKFIETEPIEKGRRVANPEDVNTLRGAGRDGAVTKDQIGQVLEDYANQDSMMNARSNLTGQITAAKGRFGSGVNVVGGQSGPASETQSALAATGPVNMTQFGPYASKNVPVQQQAQPQTQPKAQQQNQPKTQQNKTIKNHKINPGAIAVGANTVLGALSGLTGFAAKMGDASRKFTQTLLNPSPLGTNEMNAFANLTQNTANAAQSGIGSIQSTIDQTKKDKLMQKDASDFKHYQNLEKIREKYVEKMKNADPRGDWGNIADEYRAEVEDYFKNSGINMAAVKPNNIMAKQVARTTRELTNMGQRMKAGVGIENKDDLLTEKNNKFNADMTVQQDRNAVKDAKYDNATKFNNMWLNGVDINNVPISQEDHDTLDLLVNDIKDVDSAGNWTVGERFDHETYKKLSKAARNRALKATTKQDRDKWNDAAYRYDMQLANDGIAFDDETARMHDYFLKNPNVDVMTALKHLNQGKKRGYDLRDDATIQDLGFIPDKNLIKDFRYVAGLKENSILSQRFQIVDAARAQKRALNTTEQGAINNLNMQLEDLRRQRDLVTPAYLVADVGLNIWEAIERTSPHGTRISPGLKFEDEAGAQAVLAQAGVGNDPSRWFELMRRGELHTHPTDEQLKAVMMLETKKIARKVAKTLNDAWDSHVKNGTKYEGMNTKMNWYNPSTGQFEQVPAKVFLANSTADLLYNYDSSLNIIHRDGTKTPPNGKEIMAATGYAIQDFSSLVNQRLDGLYQLAMAHGMGPGTPASPWAFGSSMRVFGAGGKPVNLPSGTDFATITPAQLAQVQRDTMNYSPHDITKIVLGKWFYDLQKSQAWKNYCAANGRADADAEFRKYIPAIQELMTYDPNAGGIKSKYAKDLVDFVNQLATYEKFSGTPLITNDIRRANGLGPLSPTTTDGQFSLGRMARLLKLYKV